MNYESLSIQYHRAVATGDVQAQRSLLRELINATSDHFALCELQRRLAQIKPWSIKSVFGLKEVR